MIKSNSKTSFHSIDNKSSKNNKIEPLQHVLQIQDSLQYASKLLPHQQFSTIYERMIKNFIRKAEVQSPNNQTIYLQAVKNSLLIYGGSLQLNVRGLLLEILSGLNSRMLQQIPSKVNKAKHIVLQTHIQYLLSKIFLLQVKYHLILNDEASAAKNLKRCLELNEEHMVEFMQQPQQIRKEIVDYAIIAYYQTFKLKKSQKPTQALQNLMKACSIAKKNYGQNHKISKGLIELYNNQENLINSLQKMSMKSRAITDILDYENKRNYRTTAFYSWQDEKIVVQLLKLKGKERQVLSEASYDIKLDINKIRLLQNNEWLTTSKDGQILIVEDQLMRILGRNTNENNQKQITTGIQLRNLSKQEIIRKTHLSSSQDDQDLCLSKINLFKQPRAQSSRKYKDTQ